MRVYTTILSILDKKGPLPISIVCQEVNQVLPIHREKPILPSHIKSIVTKKKGFFDIHEGRISINPDKDPISLLVSRESCGGISYYIKVYLRKNNFAVLEWRNKDNRLPFSYDQPKTLGSLEEFKRELFTMNLWDWDPSYRNEEGILLDEKTWSVKLITKGTIYQSEGIECYPKNWGSFCRSIEKLIGMPFR
jgi:hypothetical protein